MTELDALAQLSELCEKIESNNWEHLYSKVNVPLTAMSTRIANDNAQLQTKLNLALAEKKEIEEKERNMRIKILAFKHLLQDLPNDTATQQNV